MIPGPSGRTSDRCFANAGATRNRSGILLPWRWGRDSQNCQPAGRVVGLAGQRSLRNAAAGGTHGDDFPTLRLCERALNSRRIARSQPRAGMKWILIPIPVVFTRAWSDVPGGGSEWRFAGRRGREP